MAKTRDFNRLDRVAATIKRALATPVADLARARRVGLVSITAVDVSPDLRRAEVRLSVFGGDGDADSAGVLKVLRDHAHELQSVLGSELRTRHTPVLAFVLDETLAQADRIDRLLGNPGLPGRQG
ncbi:MAG: 30S ribosome-binding factor RbfA [Gammaproteobacteria bacterium]